jgi:RNA polymerase sigma factor (sigma-70 family)
VEQLTKMEEATRVAAGRYRRSPVDREDLIQTAWVELLKSVHTYDEAKGSFFTWAMRVSVMAMRRAMFVGAAPVTGGWHALDALRECKGVGDTALAYEAAPDQPDAEAAEREFDRAVRERVAHVLGEGAVDFAMEIGEREWTLEQLAEASGCTREHAARTRHRARTMLGRDRALRALWEESGTR